MNKEIRRLSPISKRPTNSKSASQIQDLIGFLNENYDIKINSFDPSKSIIKSKKKDYVFTPSFDDISLHLTDAGVTHSDTILRKILRSPNQMTTYNPIVEYFEGLKGQYKGKSHIDLLCEHLSARDFGDKDERYYQDRLIRILRKWLAAAVACALGKHPNETALGFIQKDEGIGKTYLTKFLVPDALIDYYIQSERQSNVFDISEVFSKNLIVNFDEMVGITNRTAEEFKKVLSDSHILVKHPRDPFPINLQRLASATFTTNYNEEMGGFLTQSLGYRRFASIELEGIDQSYSKKVDVDQIWAEAYSLVNMDGFEFRFTMDDFEEFKEYNARYIKKTSALRLIEMYYTPTESEEEGSYMQAQDIARDLIRSKRVSSEDRKFINAQEIGQALTSLGFLKKSIRIPGKGTRYMYHVKKL